MATIGVTDAWATRPGEQPTYALSRWLFLRLLGVVYLCAFLSLLPQVTGLVGEHGLLPAGVFLQRAHATFGGAAYRLFPTVCWLAAGDAMLRALCWIGVALAASLIAGVAQAPVLLLLWLCYLSLSVAGQTFLWFQWDGLLLETGLLAVLFAPTQLLPSLARERAPLPAARWLIWGLLFRLMVLSGVTKLASGDRTWWELTALDYHFWTQPLPPWTAWYADRLPEWMHRGMTLAILGIELLVPALIFVPERWRRARYAGCALLLLGQLGIALTGNYGFFNLLAIVLCVPLLDDGLLRRVLPLRLTAVEPEPRWKVYAVHGLAPVFAVLATLAFVREIVHTAPGRRTFDTPLLDVVEPLRSVNGYGLFRVMTTDRLEIVIEGGDDTLHWREYEFRWKPGDVTRRPRFVAPHMPRLDWQMWFAALDPEGARAWLVPLLERLLEGAPEALALLGPTPFPNRPPRYLRLVYYRYRFSDPAGRAAGVWWRRERVGYLTRPLSMGDFRPPR
jgi:lipase maturation factor 1